MFSLLKIILVIYLSIVGIRLVKEVITRFISSLTGSETESSGTVFTREMALFYSRQKSIDEVLTTAKGMTEAKSKQTAAQGLFLARHFLIIRELLPLRKSNESMSEFFRRMSVTIDLPECWTQYAFSMAMEAPDGTPSDGFLIPYRHAWYSAIESNSHIAKVLALTDPFVTGLMRDIWSPERNCYLDKTNATQYISDQTKDAEQYVAALPEDWFEQEVESAALRVQQAKGSTGKNLYELSRFYFTLRKTKKAFDLATQAAEHGYTEARQWLAYYNHKLYPGVLYRKNKFQNDKIEQMHHKPTLEHFCLMEFPAELEPDLFHYVRSLAKTELKEKRISLDRYKELAKETPYPQIKSILTDSLLQTENEESIFTALQLMGNITCANQIHEWKTAVKDGIPDTAKQRLGYFAQAVFTGRLSDVMAFLERDLDMNAETNNYIPNTRILKTYGQYYQEATEGNIRAFRFLGTWYYTRKSPWMYKAIGNLLLDHVVFHCQALLKENPHDEEALILWHNIDSGVRNRSNITAEIFEWGMRYDMPYFYANAYFWKDELGIGYHEALRYLDRAEQMGYDTSGIRSAMQDDREYERRQQRQKQERKEVKKMIEVSHRRAAIEHELDLLEMNADIMAGGSGRTVEQKALTGDIPVKAYLDHLQIRESIISPENK